jgi:hypothetical protein
MKYACLVYIEDKKQESLSEADLDAIVGECEAAAAWEAELKKGGHYIFSAGLQSVSTATTLRPRNGRISMTDGPFAETKEFLGGFTIIEARDMNEALLLVSKFQTRMLSLEVRPLQDHTAEPTDPVDRKIAAAIRSKARI